MTQHDRRCGQRRMLPALSWQCVLCSWRWTPASGNGCSLPVRCCQTVRGRAVALTRRASLAAQAMTLQTNIPTCLHLPVRVHLPAHMWVMSLSDERVRTYIHASPYSQKERQADRHKGRHPCRACSHAAATSPPLPPRSNPAAFTLPPYRSHPAAHHPVETCEVQPYVLLVLLTCV